ncbi:hypothetical protein HY357_02765 [Candidatus Roizmanbacteria bacterium]|nr:hypothetical protein [Candidatus Roizmanbacteria bacterium]
MPHTGSYKKGKMSSKKGHKLTSAKAKKILSDGTVRGKKLTGKQKKFFGAVAGGQKPKA